MAVLKQSTSYTRMFLMVDSVDHVTGKTGLTVTLTLSKAGGAFAAAGGSVTEVSSGWYKVALNTTDTNTLGELAYHATSAGADPTDFVDQITANILGDTLPVNVTQWLGSTPNALISGRVDSNTQVIANNIIDRATFTAASGLQTIRSNTLQAGSLQGGTLDAGANANDNFYNGCLIYITGGTGVGQTAIMHAYTGATKVFAIDHFWTTQPDNTSTFAILPTRQADVSVTSGGMGITVAVNNDKVSYSLTAGERTSIADALLDRNMATGSDSGTDLTIRTPRQALRFLRNKWCITGSTLTVFKEDDATTSHTQSLATTPGANPVTCSTPA